MIRAISWAAVSSKPQAERESLNDQHRLNHALADALEWEIVVDVTVPGESRSYYRLSDAGANLEAYQQLTDLAESGAFKWLICKSRDRLARTRRLNREVAGYLQDHGIRVYSRTFPPASTEERTEAEVWSEAIESGYSEAEILRFKQRREMGMQARIRRGKLPAALPWGFSSVSVPGQEEPTVVFTDPEAEATVRFVINAFLRGLSKLRIARQAQHEHHLRSPSGQPWNVDIINRIVLQPAYYGMTAFGRRRAVWEGGRRIVRRRPPGEWIIAEAEFSGPFTPADWQRMLAERQRRIDAHPRTRAPRYPLSGIAYCLIHHRSYTGASSGAGRYYRCIAPDYWRYTRPGAYRPHSMRETVLHRMVGEYLSDLASDPSQFARLLEQPTLAAEEDFEAERQALAGQQDELVRRRQRWANAYEEGIIDLAEFAERVGTIEREETRLERRIEELEESLHRAEQRQDLEVLLRVAVRELPDLLSEELTEAQSEMLRASFTRLFRRILIRDNTIVDVELQW